MSGVAVVILAGGEARRMGGGDKGLTLLGGRPLLAHVIERLGPGAAPLALSANGDPARFAAWGLPVLADAAVEGLTGPLLEAARAGRSEATGAGWGDAEGMGPGEAAGAGRSRMADPGRGGIAGLRRGETAVPGRREASGPALGEVAGPGRGEVSGAGPDEGARPGLGKGLGKGPGAGEGRGGARPGPLAGVLSAMDWAAGLGQAQVATVPWDTPFLPRDLLARLAEAAEAGGAPIALACGPDAERGEALHPAVGLWSCALREDLRAALAAGTRRVRGWAAVQGFATARFEGPPDPFFNINTPADMAQAERVWSSLSSRSPLPAPRKDEA